MTLPTFSSLGAAVWPDSTDIDKADIRAWALTVERALNALITEYAVIGGMLNASVAANVLTVAVKTLAGADPSAADPVYIAFRDVNQGDGDEAVVAVTSALSMTVSAGSVLGGVDGEAMRLWVVAFNDGGTVRLGIINCLSAAAQVFSLDESLVQSATAEGGAGAADSAGVLYASAAITSKSMRILGHLTWEASALATAGLYSSAPDVVQMMGPGVRKPGDLVQAVRISDAALNTITATTPFDDTIPQVSEGEEVLSQAITPTSRANLLAVESNLSCALSAAGSIVAHLHKDTDPDALAARAVDISAVNDRAAFTLRHWMKSLTVSSIDMNVRIGVSAGTGSFNGSNATRDFGGANYSDLVVREIMA